jgi:hypothetical protein
VPPIFSEEIARETRLPRPLAALAYSPEKSRTESVTRAIWNATKIKLDLNSVMAMACSLELCDQGEMVVSFDHHPTGLITA